MQVAWDGPTDSAHTLQMASIQLFKSVEVSAKVCRKAFEFANLAYVAVGYNRFVCLCNRSDKNGWLKIEVTLRSSSKGSTLLTITADGSKKTPLMHLLSLRYIEFIRQSIEKFGISEGVGSKQVISGKDGPQILPVESKHIPSIPSAGFLLGTLLTQSRSITHEQMDEAKKRSAKSGLPVGRILVLMGAIRHNQLLKVAELQCLILAKKISVSEAIRDLESELNAQPASHFTGAKKRHPADKYRLGELLNQAGVISQSDVLMALEISLERNYAFGGTLVQLGLIDDETLEVALDVQRRIAKSEISVDKAIALLKEHYSTSYYRIAC
jgi:hypothetical protein